MTHHITDEQILTEAARHLGEMHVENCGLGDIKAFARAVLALAAPQGEPVATLHCTEECYVYARVTEAGKRLRFEGAMSLYAHNTALAPAVPSDEPAEFERAYNRLFRGRGVDTRHISDCEAVWMARAALATAPTPPAQQVSEPEVAIPDDGPSTYEQRFTEAVALICGAEPHPELVSAWIAGENEALQHWVGGYAPGWVQNIAVLDAAHQLADQPTEGGDHEMRSKQPAAPEDVARLDALGTPGWELSMNDDPECGPDELWQVHRVSGGRNDREWTLIGSGANPRAAIDAARKAGGAA